MSEVDAPILIGVVTVIVGIFSILNSFGMAFFKQRADRRAKAVEIYDEYYSPENYRRMVLPVFCIMMKWRHLPEPKRAAYRTALRRAWVGFDTDTASILNIYAGKDYLHENPEEAHFHKVIPSGAFTEHESLTVVLYFWTKVWELIRVDVVDPKVAKRLLAKPYGYISQFIQEYRQEIAQHSSVEDLPPWYDATQKLDRFFFE